MQRFDRGSTQHDLYSTALNPTSIKIDNRSLVDFIEQTRQNALSTDFVNQKNEVSGNWYQFFETNPLFIATEFIKWPIDAWYSEYEKKVVHLKNIDTTKNETSGKKACLESLLAVFAFVDQCLKKMSDAHTFDINKPLRNEFKLAINRSVGQSFTYFNQLYSLYINSDQTIKWSNYWPNLIKDEKDKAAPTGKQFADEYQLLKNVGIQIKEAFKFLAIRIEALLPELLGKTGEHSPQVGLLLSFFRSNVFLQDKLNEFTKRHLDTFYRDLLDQKPKPAVADFTYAILPLPSHVEQALVTKNEKLVAGTYENGTEITYQLTAQYGLNTAQIAKIRQLYVARNKAVGVSDSLGFVSGMYKADYNVTEAGFLTEINQSSLIEVPLFGEDQLMLSASNRIMQFAKLGFSISSPTFFLKEGQRDVSVIFELDKLSMTSLINYIEEVSTTREMSADAAMQLILGSIFEINYTGVSGWQKVERYAIGLEGKWADAKLRIDFSLGISAEPFLAYDNEVHGKGYAVKNEPILSFHLKADDTLYGYSFIRDLAIDSYTIEVQVKGIRSLKLFNNYGALDQDSLFNPFGTPSKVGSYLLVGYEELATKTLTDLSIDISWFNLPRLIGGFKKYYEGYNADIDNSSFEVEVSMLSNYEYKPSKQKQLLPLFEIDPDTEKLVTKTTFDGLNLDILSAVPTYKMAEDLQPNAEAGFLKFELVNPEIGFGEEQYPSLLTKALMHNAQEKKVEKHIVEPKEPISPQANAIKLSYKARTKVSLNEMELSMNEQAACGSFYHLTPFSIKPTFENGIVTTQAMVPKYLERGFLYLAFTGSFKSGELNILLELDESKIRDVNSYAKRKVVWQYLLDGRWVNFKDAEILSDHTNSLSNSGIIRFIIPKSLQDQANRKESAENLIEDDKYTWIRVVTDQSAWMFPNLAYIKSNAVSVEWVQTNESTTWPGTLKPNSIERFKNERSDIGEVSQPFASFGGQKEEHELAFYQRVANRIHHKNRLFRPQDIEHYLLDHYPSLYQVKCLQPEALVGTTFANSMAIIAVPRIKENAFFYLPYLGERQRIEIEKKLASKISPHIKASLINPFYERVRIVANMVFEEGLDKGQAIEMLNHAIRTYLCPWFNEPQQAMEFKSALDKDLFQDYIESLPYVTFVSKFSILLIKDDGDRRDIIDSAKGNALLKGSKAWSVFIPDYVHDITVVEETDYENPQSLNLSRMEIGDDFVLGDANAGSGKASRLASRENKLGFRITISTDTENGTI
jgi:hypothetical protein